MISSVTSFLDLPRYGRKELDKGASERVWRKRRYMFRKRNRRSRVLWLVISILVVAIGLIWLIPWLTFSSMNVEAPKVDAPTDQPEQGASKDQPENEIALEDSPPPMEEEVSNNLPPSSSPPPPPPAQASAPPPAQASAPPVQASAPPPAQTPSLPSTPAPSPPREEVPKNFLPPNSYWDYGANYWDYAPDYYWYYEPDYYWDY
jgi:cytoskeletal protein RodZ